MKQLNGFWEKKISACTEKDVLCLFICSLCTTLQLEQLALQPWLAFKLTAFLILVTYGFVCSAQRRGSTIAMMFRVPMVWGKKVLQSLLKSHRQQILMTGRGLCRSHKSYTSLWSKCTYADGVGGAGSPLWSALFLKFGFLHSYHSSIFQVGQQV